MQIWQDLIKYTLIGTERQTAALSADGDLQPLIAQLYPENTVPNGEMREHAFLSSAALVAQYRLAGQLPVKFSGELPLIDDSEALPELSPQAVQHLNRLLDESELKAILPEWLALAAKSGRRVPFSLIPRLLKLAGETVAFRPAMTALIGSRGIWLAKQHPDWHKFLVQADDEILNQPELWEDGTTAQRTEFLRQTRVKNAEAARDLLQSVWKKEPAAARESFLSVFSLNLTEADEAFLNSCLTDRAKGVAEQARKLLAHTPNSAFSQRQKARLNQWLRFEKGGLLKKDKIIVELPESYDKAWLIDGIEEKPPVHIKKGEKAWWLEQALSFVPPAYWSEHWQLPPDKLLTLLEKHDWRETILAGWRQALQNYPVADWASAYLLQFDINLFDLWKILPSTQVEELATQLLKNANGNESVRVLMLLKHLQHAWSVAFSKQVIAALQRYTQQKLTASEVYSCSYLKDFGYYLAPECGELFANRLQKEYEHYQITQTIDKIFFTLNFRRDMIAVLTNPTK